MDLIISFMIGWVLNKIIHFSWNIIQKFIQKYRNKKKVDKTNLSFFFQYLALKQANIFISMLDCIGYYKNIERKKDNPLKKYISVNDLKLYCKYLAKEYHIAYYELFYSFIIENSGKNSNPYLTETLVSAAQEVGEEYKKSTEHPFVAYLIHIAEKDSFLFIRWFYYIMLFSMDNENDKERISYLKRIFLDAFNKVYENKKICLVSLCEDLAKQNHTEIVSQPFIDILSAVYSDQWIDEYPQQEMPLKKSIILDGNKKGLHFFRKHVNLQYVSRNIKSMYDNSNIKLQDENSKLYLIYLANYDDKCFLKLFKKIFFSHEIEATSNFKDDIINAAQEIGKKYDNIVFYFCLAIQNYDEYRPLFETAIEAVDAINKEKKEDSVLKKERNVFHFKKAITEIAKQICKKLYIVAYDEIDTYLEKLVTKNYKTCYIIFDKIWYYHTHKRVDCRHDHTLHNLIDKKEKSIQSNLISYFSYLSQKDPSEFSELFCKVFSNQWINKHNKEKNFPFLKEVIVQAGNKTGMNFLKKNFPKYYFVQKRENQYSKNSFMPYLIYLAYEHPVHYSSLFQNFLLFPKNAQYDRSLKQNILWATQKTAKLYTKKSLFYYFALATKNYDEYRSLFEEALKAFISKKNKFAKNIFFLKKEPCFNDAIKKITKTIDEKSEIENIDKHINKYYFMFEKVSILQKKQKNEFSLKKAIILALEETEKRCSIISYFIHNTQLHHTNIDLIKAVYSDQWIKKWTNKDAAACLKEDLIEVIRIIIEEKYKKYSTELHLNFFPSYSKKAVTDILKEIEKNCSKNTLVFYFIFLEKVNNSNFIKLLKEVFFLHETEDKYDFSFKKSLIQALEELGKKYDKNTKNGLVSYFVTLAEKDPQNFSSLLFSIITYQYNFFSKWFGKNHYNYFLKKSLIQALKKLEKKYDKNTKNGLVSYFMKLAEKEIQNFSSLLFSAVTYQYNFFSKWFGKNHYSYFLKKSLIQAGCTIGKILHKNGLCSEDIVSKGIKVPVIKNSNKSNTQNRSQYWYELNEENNNYITFNDS
ncbi:hypothetical protein [Bartonella sp. F02]|uniref:hypothetical protein n=1 Tax=Bartonella sp. F02 TaxID=2967262 RepID=UPI0022A96C8B|nr:hypothetical protein [Bartonella sp. F02]MCZ2328943.1 hypothetical protein [Bartonella sp. F02]